MPIDASRNPYDSPRFDSGGGKAVRPDSAGKDELDDDLDDALDDLGAGAKGPAVDDADVDEVDTDLDAAGTGSKGDLVLDEADAADVKAASSIDGLSASVGDDGSAADGKGSFDLDDAEADLADSGAGAKGSFALDDDVDDDLGDPDLKALGGDIGDDGDDLDGFSSLKGDAFDDGDLGDAADGGAFGADLGEVPDVGDKDAFDDDDSSLFEQKGSILDAVAEDMRGGVDDDPGDVDF
jgi:hypothetical protein